MKNMAAADRMAPMKALCQLKNLKPGLKLGAELILSRKHARFIVKNVNCILLATMSHRLHHKAGFQNHESQSTCACSLSSSMR